MCSLHSTYEFCTQKPTSSQNTCSSSITYLLDGTVGLMGDLAHLALVASFAREVGSFPRDLKKFIQIYSSLPIMEAKSHPLCI